MKSALSSFAIIIFFALFFSINNTYSNQLDTISQQDRKFYFDSIEKIRKEANEQNVFFRNNIEKDLRLSIWIFGIAFGASLILLSVFGFKSLREIKRSVEKRAIEASDRILSQKLKDTVDTNVDYLQGQINLEKQYQNSKIIFIGDAATIDRWSTFEMALLRKSGLKKLTSSLEVNHSYLDVDIVVYAYTANKNEDSRLKEILQRLQSRQPIPLIIYTGKNKISNEQKEMLDNYGWYVFSNMPFTLLTHIYNTAKMFYSTNGTQ